MPMSRNDPPTVSGEAVTSTPRVSRTSALPHRLEMERLPCFAVFTPAPAATKAATVEILNVEQPSPPVPQVSRDRLTADAVGDGRRPLAHGQREAVQLLGCLALGVQSGQEGRNLGSGRKALQNQRHGFLRFHRREILARAHAVPGRVRTTCYIEGCFGFPTGYHSRKTGPNPMKIHEYQAKAILAQYNVPVPRGEVAFTVEEAEAAAKELGGSVVVKAQIHAGGRGKGGGVKVAKDAAEATADRREDARA